jgi:hypothetical protein
MVSRLTFYHVAKFDFTSPTSAPTNPIWHLRNDAPANTYVLGITFGGSI